MRSTLEIQPLQFRCSGFFYVRSVTHPSFAPLPAFDPRDVPVVRVDHHLPAVPAAAQTPSALRQRFATPPLWQPEVVQEKQFLQRTMAPAAVLVPIVLREQPTVLLTERTHNLSTHSGQIAFPGGRVDASDANTTAAALREAQEEIGLQAGHVEVLGSLHTYTTGSSFIVTPVVALVDPACQLSANPHEVADVFEVPLAFLLDPAHHRLHRFAWAGTQREWFSMPYRDTHTERYIWGATAGMLRNLYRFLLA